MKIVNNKRIRWLVCDVQYTSLKASMDAGLIMSRIEIILRVEGICQYSGRSGIAEIVHFR
jgi:hypothetical protein